LVPTKKWLDKFTTVEWRHGNLIDGKFAWCRAERSSRDKRGDFAGKGVDRLKELVEEFCSRVPSMERPECHGPFNIW